MSNEARDEALEKAKALHRPKSTGREEYRLDELGNVIGEGPTFVCSIMCEPTWYFKGDGCATWKLLSEVTL